MSLQITQEERENRELLLTIEVGQDRVDQELRKAARKVAPKYRIPGFRKGKAPYHVIAQQVGIPALYNEFVDKLGEEIYLSALEQEGLEPYARATFEDVSMDPLTFKLVMPMDPKIDLGTYRDLRLEETVPEVNEEDVEAQLERYRTQHAEEIVVERPSQYGDTMNVDLRSVIAPQAEGDEEIIVLDQDDWDVTPDEENPIGPPGLDQALLGLAPGDEKEFDISWPDDSQSPHAGKTAHFTVTINSIKAKEKPALDDKFAQLIGPNFETVEDLRKSIRDSMSEQLKVQAQNEYLEQVLSTMVARSKLSYPSIVIEDQINSMLNDVQVQLQRLGVKDLNSYFQKTGKTMEEMRADMREDAVKQAEQNLVISEILRAESLAVSDEELETQISLMIQSGKSEEAEQLATFFRTDAGRSAVESQVLRDKALAQILAITRGQASALDEVATQAESANDASVTDGGNALEASEVEGSDMGEGDTGEGVVTQNEDAGANK